jgi:hypothetical protein
MTRPLTALVMGGCLLRRPLRSVPDLQAKLVVDRYGIVKVTHSVTEMIQAVEFLKGAKRIPPDMRAMTSVGPLLQPMPEGDDFRDLDLVLAEPGSPVDITFRGLATNRGRITDLVIKPIEDAVPEARKFTQKWIRLGLMEMKEDARQELSANLLALIPDDEHAEFRRAVISETRATPSDVVGGLRTLRELTNRPVGVVIFVFRYMPDGRPLSWPAGSREGAIAAAKALDLPYFEPTAMVQQHGVQNALEQDQRHYTPEFLPIVGEAIVAFARDVHALSAGAEN